MTVLQKLFLVEFQAYNVQLLILLSCANVPILPPAFQLAYMTEAVLFSFSPFPSPFLGTIIYHIV